MDGLGTFGIHWLDPSHDDRVKVDRAASLTRQQEIFRPWRDRDSFRRVLCRNMSLGPWFKVLEIFGSLDGALS
jgi:hypothetical protein